MPGESEPGFTIDYNALARAFNREFKQDGLSAFILHVDPESITGTPPLIHILPTPELKARGQKLGCVLKGHLTVYMIAARHVVISFRNGHHADVVYLGEARQPVPMQSRPIDLKKYPPGTKVEAVVLVWFRELYTAYVKAYANAG
jgi:hypothetical protein